MNAALKGSHQIVTVVNALRVAAAVYLHDASLMRDQNQHGLSGQFNVQAREAAELADELESQW